VLPCVYTYHWREHVSGDGARAEHDRLALCGELRLPPLRGLDDLFGVLHAADGAPPRASRQSDIVRSEAMTTHVLRVPAEPRTCRLREKSALPRALHTYFNDRVVASSGRIAADDEPTPRGSRAVRGVQVAVHEHVEGRGLPIAWGSGIRVAQGESTNMTASNRSVQWR